MADYQVWVYTKCMRKRGYTFTELVIAIAILVILGSMVAVAVIRQRDKAKLARVSDDLTAIANSLAQYAEDNNYQYPADTSRAVPPGLEKYLAGGGWPTSVWPHGVFDWDNWTTVNGVASPQIFQISYRLCDVNDPIGYCSDPILFPTFTRYSSIFYCISGPCVPHQNYPNDPGYCVNCTIKKVNY
jgi:prepilin-type N-terminal cleavage/methylation domain-containing protein